jgi:hypothetical protein
MESTWIPHKLVLLNSLVIDSISFARSPVHGCQKRIFTPFKSSGFIDNSGEIITVGKGVAVRGGVAFETDLGGRVGDDDGLDADLEETCAGWHAANHKVVIKTKINRPEANVFEEFIFNGMIELYNL